MESTAESTIAGAFVLEPTVNVLRVGYAGDCLPQGELPLAVGRMVASLAVCPTPLRTCGVCPLNPAELKQDIEVVEAIKYDPESARYIVQNSDALAAVLEFILTSKGSQYYTTASPLQCPLLIVEPAVTDVEFRSQIGHVLFDDLKATAVFFAKQPALAAFACGRVSATVWDSGYSRTTASIVNDGYVIPSSVVEVPIGGRYFTRKLAEYLTESGQIDRVSPLFALDPFKGQTTRRPFVEQSYWDWSVMAVIRNTQVSTFRFRSTSTPSQNTSSLYTLPDGTQIEIPAEVTFLPTVLLSSASDAGNPTSVLEFEGRKLDTTGLVAMISEAHQKSELKRGAPKMRDSLDALMLCGGVTCFPNFMPRVEEIISQTKNPLLNNPELKLLTPPNGQIRRFAAMVGGSILACLGSFKHFAVSRSEYNEYGYTAFQRKCS